MNLRLLLAGAFALGLSSTHVCAQSAPGWATGFKPSAAQWNAAFAAKQDLIGAGGVSASMLASGAAAANISGGAISPSSINVSSGPINLGSYTTPMSALGGTSAVFTNPMTFGIYGQAVGASVVANSTHGPQVTGLTTPSKIATYASRDSVSLYVDNTAPPLIANAAGTFTTTTFVPTVALSAGIVSQLKVGMIIDTSDATKYSGFITGWASDGSSITVSAWYQFGNQGAGQTPSGPNALINPVTKIWAHNANVLLNPSSYATAAAGFELGIQNNYGYNSGTDTPYTWGFDAVNIGTYTASVGHIARGDFNYGFESWSGRLAGFYYFPGSTQVGPGFLVGKTISGATGFETDQTSGTGFLASGTNGTAFAASSTALGQYLAAGSGAAPLVNLGSQTAASAPTIQLYANGSSNADVGIAGVAGGGSTYGGKLAILANALYVTPGSGSNNLLISGGAGGSNNTTISTSGIDTDISVSIGPKGAGKVNLGTNTANYLSVAGSGTGVSIKDIAAGSDSTINRVVSGKSTGVVCIGAASDCGNEALRVLPVASQVNAVQVSGAATGGIVKVSAIGSDTTINMAIAPKGAGLVCVGGTSCGNEAMRVLSVASQANSVQVSGAVAGSGASISAYGSDTDIDLPLIPKGAGTVKVTVNGLKLPSTTVAGLPTCAAGNAGTVAYVTDASSPTYNATLTGGSSTKTLAMCNGTNWTAH